MNNKLTYMTIAFLFFCNHLIYAFVDRTDKDEDVGFNYVGEDNRSFMRCDQYSESEIDSLERKFEDVMSKALTKREKVINSANFLVNLSHVIPYAHETYDKGYELAWKYTRKGLFLRSIVENGYLYPAWGCEILTPKELIGSVKDLGETYRVGFHCSSFIRWCLYNADAVSKNILEASRANDFGNFPGTKKLVLKKSLDKIRPGDLIYFYVDENNGHIALIIGVKGDVVTFVESARWDGHTDPRNGLRWRTFNKKTTDFDKYRFKYLIQMNEIYGD